MFKSILRLLGTILIAVAFAFVLIMCVGERTKVSGHSMEPHLHDHDQVLLDKLTYRFRDPKRYEIIVFPGPEGGDQFFVKRVIALPGETVKITKGKVYVNDKEVKDYSKDYTTDSCELKGKFHLSSDEYFVLGDNRDNSNDSRYKEVGPVKRSKDHREDHFPVLSMEECRCDPAIGRVLRLMTKKEEREARKLEKLKA